MRVLGITDGVTCGAAIVRDGSVIAAVNEERLTRFKMAYGFPWASVREVMALANATPEDIDLVVVATLRDFFFDQVKPFDGWFQQDRGWIRNSIFSWAGRASGIAGGIPGAERLYYAMRSPMFAKRQRGIRSILRKQFRISAPIEFANHHLAHATSAYFTSGFNDAIVVTMDGGGDGDSSHVYEMRKGGFKRITSTSAFNSLANYYAYVTHICGFKAQKHEGKITGLAAHGNPIYRDLLDRLITFRNGEIQNVGGRVFLGAVEQIVKSLPKGWEKADLAASIQQHCEEIALSVIRHHVISDGPTDIAIAGGLFANVRINQKVYELDCCDRLFVHPGMTDCGLAVGAALLPCLPHRSRATMPRQPDVINDVYLGREYQASEIEQSLKKSGLRYSKPQSMATEVAKLLADGCVVARFAGRMEYGPRALGNRSILYQPSDPTVNDWLNQCLNRTEFMPFAPSTTMEAAGEFYINHEGAADTARFMTITFDCTDRMKATCPGVVHIDGTARPQLVRRDDNPDYYQIISEFGKITGIPTVINTSFNMHEEPIVCSPDDAIRAFKLGHLDYLAIGEFLVPALEPVPRQRVPMKRFVTQTSGTL